MDVLTSFVVGLVLGWAVCSTPRLVAPDPAVTAALAARLRALLDRLDGGPKPPPPG